LVFVRTLLYKRWEQPLTLLVTFIITIPFKKGRVCVRRYLRHNAITYRLNSALTIECFKTDVTSFLFPHTRLLGLGMEHLKPHKLHRFVVSGCIKKVGNVADIRYVILRILAYWWRT
jgi:hypothetical protein